jgi:hypothetical protein
VRRSLVAKHGARRRRVRRRDSRALADNVEARHCMFSARARSARHAASAVPSSPSAVHATSSRTMRSAIGRDTAAASAAAVAVERARHQMAQPRVRRWLGRRRRCRRRSPHRSAEQHALERQQRLGAKARRRNAGEQPRRLGERGVEHRGVLRATYAA